MRIHTLFATLFAYQAYLPYLGTSTPIVGNCPVEVPFHTQWLEIKLYAVSGNKPEALTTAMMQPLGT